MLRYLLPRRFLKNETIAANDAMTGEGYAQVIQRTAAEAAAHLYGAAWLSLPIGLLGLLPSIFLLQVFNRVITRGGMATLTAMVAGAVCLLGLEWWLRRRRSRALREVGATMDHGISNALMQSMLKRPLQTLEQRSASQWLQLFRDVGTMRASVSGGFIAALFDLPMALLALIVIGIVAWPVLPVILVAMLVLGVVAWWTADEVRSGRVEEMAQSRMLDRGTAEICQARNTLKVLGDAGPAQTAWQQGYDRWLAESFQKNGELEGVRDSTTVLLTFFSITVITVGAVAIHAQWMSLGSLMAVNLLTSKALGPITQLASNWRTLARSNEATQRLESVFAEPVERSQGTLSLPRPAGKLRLDHVSFCYTSDHPALVNVTLDMAPGGMHVIVGGNGAGKSTLGKLLAGLYTPSEGRVFLDEYDVAQFTRAELSQWIGYLSQQVYWFSGPIVEGLRQAVPDAEDRHIVMACQLAGAHDFISRLPQGYQTVVGEGGLGLSGGELRKLAIAQILLRNPSVLILDEPTNDLDFDSETALLLTLRKIAQKHTVIVITHSLRVASMAQHIHHVTGRGDVVSGKPDDMLPALFQMHGKPREAEPAIEGSAEQVVKV